LAATFRKKPVGIQITVYIILVIFLLLFQYIDNTLK